MPDLLIGAASAFWLGILTSISPCPLATNIAAISYIGKRVEKPRLVLLSGVLYTLGRSIAYAALAALLVFSLLSAPYASHVLQKYANKILGPLLILVGMFLLDLIRFNWTGGGVSDQLARRVERTGLLGSLLLGMIFALSFCPVSAALFFGSLLPLAIRANSSVMLPSLYGFGTALPVVVFAVIIALGARSLGKAFASVAAVERWARRLTGVVFIGVGIYFALIFIFRVKL